MISLDRRPFDGTLCCEDDDRIISMMMVGWQRLETRNFVNRLSLFRCRWFKIAIQILHTALEHWTKICFSVIYCVRFQQAPISHSRSHYFTLAQSTNSTHTHTASIRDAPAHLISRSYNWRGERIVQTFRNHKLSCVRCVYDSFYTASVSIQSDVIRLGIKQREVAEKQTRKKSNSNWKKYGLSHVRFFVTYPPPSTQSVQTSIGLTEMCSASEQCRMNMRQVVIIYLRTPSTTGMI